MSKNIPFHCGTQFIDWQARNCDRCAKFDNDSADCGCLIAMALYECSWSGNMSDDMAKRCGYIKDDETKRALEYSWDCPERELLEGEQKPDHPNQMFIEDVTE